MADKWALLDRGTTAHWWLGNSGTACGRDFKSDLRIADDIDSPLCRKCVMALPQLIAEKRN